MKKIIAAFSAAALLALSGCGDTSTVDRIAEENAPASSSEPTKSPAELAEPETSTQAETTSAAAETQPISVSDEEMLDLSAMSASVVYGQVFDMVNNPDDYTGRMIKAKGPFAYYQDPATNKEYFAVLITDAMACCSQGIEFVLDGDKKYPDDYPEINEEITVTGVFNFYTEGTNKYCQLLNAQIVND
ncbi:MAG: hypothetical protein K6A79_05700 [Ruminococcus sp.]|nr:hypothetical protein [Ruminococcus sp.]